MINKKNKKILTFTVAILFIGICFVPLTNASTVNKTIRVLEIGAGATLYVGGSGGGNYSTIC